MRKNRDLWVEVERIAIALITVLKFRARENGMIDDDDELWIGRVV